MLLAAVALGTLASAVVSDGFDRGNFFRVEMIRWKDGTFMERHVYSDSFDIEFFAFIFDPEGSVAVYMNVGAKGNRVKTVQYISDEKLAALAILMDGLPGMREKIYLQLGVSRTTKPEKPEWIHPAMAASPLERAAGKPGPLLLPDWKLFPILKAAQND